ncbi:Glutaredoxin-3 [Zancudomyces culisetae]|uniref:Glutaredoxin-3 n=1 Tax=Zancudomyces culisetae TaxID=1213189 RepID=A0A1R1PNB3_ZANCU|nr:Glutaredoxin-3 [Zancudomyces culisetae]|eukprot:OMH82457.1 Glutaredoxin-3 [Zancudomyces culisetae]
MLLGTKIEGYDIQEIQNLSSKLTSAAQRQPTRQPVSPAILSSPPELGREALNTKLKALVNEAAVMTFIKGTPNMPRCKFSRRLVDILNENNIIFGYFDILSDEQVRQGLKEFSNWPTYPQLYIKGELVGGIDIVQEMVDNEELLECVPSESIRA